MDIGTVDVRGDTYVVRMLDGVHFVNGEVSEHHVDVEERVITITGNPECTATILAAVQAGINASSQASPLVSVIGPVD